MAREQPAPVHEDGPSLDLGDLDWTIPPDPTPGGSSWSRGSLGWAARRFRDAVMHATVSFALTGLLVGWWIASGTMPTADPTAGPMALVLHVGAFLTGWFALRAAVDTWQVLYLRADVTDPPKANLTQVISVGAALVLCFQAAMVVASLLR